MKNLEHRFIFLISLIVVLLCACNCFEAGNHRTAKNLSAVILDESGRPIEGALFYVEAYTHKLGVFDFAFGFAGAEGEIPASGSPPLSIGWRNDTRLALAAFAPKRKPIVIYDQLVRIEADGIELTLQKLPRPGLRWEPRIGHLGFPFEDKPALASRISRSDHEALCTVFQEAYAPLASGEESAVTREWKKLKFLENLKGAK